MDDVQHTSSKHVAFASRVLMVGLLRGWLCKCMRVPVGGQTRLRCVMQKETELIDPAFMSDLDSHDWCVRSSGDNITTAEMYVAVHSNETFTVKHLVLSATHTCTGCCG